MYRNGVCWLLLATAMAGCGGAGSSPSTSSSAAARGASTTEVDGTNQSSGGSSTESGNPANLGDKALKIGQWREGTDIRTRVRSITQSANVKLPSYLVGDSEAQGAIADVEMCARASAEGPITGYSHRNFVVFDADGGQYQQASSSWDVWPPRPQFPAELNIAPGQCARGWILFSVPADTRVTKISNGGSDQPTAEWLLQ